MCSAGIGSGYEMSYNAKRNSYKGKDTKETYKITGLCWLDERRLLRTKQLE